MTPADQDRPATGSASDQPSSHVEAQPGSSTAPAVSRARHGTDEGTVVPAPDAEAPQPPQRQPGEDEREPLDDGDVVAAEVPEHPSEFAADQAVTEHKVDAHAAGSSPPQDEAASMSGQHGHGQDEIGRDGAGLSSQRQDLRHDQSHEDQGQEPESGPAARGSSLPQGPPAPVPHDRAHQIAPQVAPEDHASSAVSTPGDSATVGWFSASADRALVTRTLSERLSAERPVDEPVGGPAAEEDASPGSARDPVVAPPTGDPIGPTDTPTATGPSRVQESHGADIPRSNESRSGASGDAAALPSGEVPRSPELIEAGMVYVDPDPEIGPPSTAPKAAGWGEQSPPPPSPGPSTALQAQPVGAESAGLEEMHGAEASSLTGVNPVLTGPANDQTVGSAEPQGQHDAGVPYRHRQHGADDEQHPRGTSQISPATAALDAAGSIDESPWTEPALPMGGLPAGRPSSIRDGEARQQDENATDEPLTPRPDPSWPRLFEQRQGAFQPRVEDTSNNQVRAGSRPGMGSGTGADEPADHAAGTPGSAQGAVRSVSEQVAAQVPSAPEEQANEPAAIVNLTEPDASAASEAAPQSGAARRSVAGSGPQSPEPFAGGAGTPEQANISTVAQVADAGEVDLRDQPAGSHGEDVSRETSAGGGEGMDPAQEEEALEDEAALAVREAVSRAAAEAGVDVSRETEFMGAGAPFDGAAGEQSIDRESAARNARVSFRIHHEPLDGERRVLAVANQKGGVGKSTTAVNIGAYLALAGARVLVVDLDPQGNASTGLGLDHRDIEPSIYDVLTGDAPPTAAIRATGVANLHVLPSTIDLAGAEVELVSAMSRETRLRRALESVDHQYDTILIDCPPSLGLLTVNALAAANELLIPIQCEYYALEGLGQLLRNVELVRANLNPELRIGGIVLTMYDGRTRLALQVVDEVRKHFTELVYQTVVPRSVRLSEAPGYGLPIALYDPLSRGGIAYRDLTFELAERSGLLAPTGEGAS